MDYLDFVLRLDIGASGGLVVRLDSPAGQAEASFEPPPIREEVERAAEEFERLLEEGQGQESFRDVSPRGVVAAIGRQKRIGDQLFKALFREPVRDRYQHSLGSLEARPNLGLRIKVQMGLSDPSVAALQGLPWELLYRAEDGTFLGRMRRTSIVRYLDLPLPGGQPPLPLPLRVLVVAARPRGVRPLPHVEREVLALRKLASQHSGLEVEKLMPPTLERLRQELLSGGFHVLHFLGHGAFREADGEGALYLEDDSGGPVAITGPMLADHLRDITSLRLAVLNACQTARTSAPGPFGGVATALLRAGLPAVVAMQFPIGDRAAAAFSAGFYSRLVAGDPLDAAVSEGRLKIHRDLPKAADWATPVLFLRSSDGRIFEPRQRSRKPWGAAAGLVLLGALGLLVAQDRLMNVLVPESSRDSSSEARPTQAPERSASGQQEAGQSVSTPEPPLVTRGVAFPSPSPSPSGGEPQSIKAPPSEPVARQQRRVPVTYTLSDRQPVYLPEIKAHLTASFNVYYGNLFVTLTLAPEKASGVKQIIAGTTTVEFQTEQGTCRIQVLALDEKARTVTVLPSPS
ncbi:MAG TPA: CHAT domain-containing protein [Thermoanaerobaculia bacterium]|nr:CHAT domain-containing protein [Thermoanaerobaculia bacterium]